MSSPRRQVVIAADIDKVDGVLTVAADAIITPSAQDRANFRGVTIVRQVTDAEASSRSEKDTAELLPDQLAAKIDHTNLQPTAGALDIERLCAEAIEFGFACVCVQPVRVALAADLRRGSNTSVCSVVGFPSGTHHTAIKQHEAELAVHDGAVEIDMVANAGLLIDDNVAGYAADIRSVRSTIGESTILKVIIEASQLSEENVVRAAIIAQECGVCYVKTSTGVYGKARIDDVTLLRSVLQPTTKIKAAGGITTWTQALELLRAGADRLGMSRSVSVMKELKLQLEQ